MGLDNIPHDYPCTSRKTAVMVSVPTNSGGTVERIDCEQTQAAGGCPWKNANPPEKGRVLGMLGTDCWYRGKYGNALLQEYGELDQIEGYSFYGSGDDPIYKGAAECLRLSEYITDIIDHIDQTGDDRERREDLEYAAWWLKWAALEANGSDCWY